MSCRIALSLAAAFALAACGPTSGDDDDDDDIEGAHLRIEPGDVTLTVENNTPAVQTYRVIAVADDGGETDVSDRATLAIGLPLGSFDGPVFTSAADRGGRTIVTATWE